MEFVAGEVVAGRFRLERELGHGGMGSVWLCQDSSLDTPCAIKFIHGQAAEDPAMRARFEREAKSAAQLRSPNVVQILDHGVSDGTPYIAMELLEGEDLDHRLRRVGRLSPQEAVYIMTQVGKALTRANVAGLVHRDLKPANIFLVRDEDRDIPKVLDFGVAKSTVPELADSSTKTGALMGTPFYMSPEQTRGMKTIDHRSDLWALAVITFQCITGRLPFLSDNLGDLLFKIGTDPIPMPTAVAPDLPQSFDAWWARASQRDPNLRFQTAKEFVDALAMSFGLSHGAGTQGFPQAAPGPGGTFALPSPSTGNGASGWGASQSGSAVHGTSGAPVLQGATGAPVTQVGGMPPQKRGAGLVVGVIGGAVVLGVIGAVAAFRFSGPPRPPTPAVAASSDAPSPSASARPTVTVTTAPSATPAPAVSTSASASATPATPPSNAPGPQAKVPGVPAKTAKTAAPTTTVAPQVPAKPHLPNDGI